MCYMQVNIRYKSVICKTTPSGFQFCSHWYTEDQCCFRIELRISACNASTPAHNHFPDSIHTKLYKHLIQNAFTGSKPSRLSAFVSKDYKHNFTELGTKTIVYVTL